VIQQRRKTGHQDDRASNQHGKNQPPPRKHLVQDRRIRQRPEHKPTPFLGKTRQGPDGIPGCAEHLLTYPRTQQQQRQRKL